MARTLTGAGHRPRKANMSIAVIGSPNSDHVVHLERRPIGGETILGSDLVTTPGGKGANQAVAAALMGGDVRFVGRVGKDGHGDLLRGSLSSAGASLIGLGTVEIPTGVALITVTPDGENSIIVSPGANAHVTPMYLESVAPAWQDADLIVMQLEVPMASVEYVAHHCAGTGTRFLLNCAPAATISPAVLAACDPLVVNETEAAFLLGDEQPAQPAETARRLLALGPASVVLTLGSAGSVALARGGTPVEVPARTVPAVDTTGAGDAFVGAMAAALTTGGTLLEGLDLGTRVAAHAVQHRGAQTSYPHRSDLEAS